MNPQLKDHYRTLEIAPAATLQEVKTAYRRLARLYHPDTNKGAFAATRFHDIKEAYDILAHEGRRKQYDEERWLMGMGNRARDKEVVTAAWILKESRKLSLHIATVDTYRMSHSALYDYILLLLSDAHMAILQQEADANTNEQVIAELLKATGGLRHIYMDALAPRLATLAGSNNVLQQQIYEHARKSHRQAIWEKYFSVIIFSVAIILCLLMYFYGRK